MRKDILSISMLFFAILFLATSVNAQTWDRIAGPWDGNISQLSADNRNPATVFAGGSDGVYRSTDNGLSWTQVSTADGSKLAQGDSNPGYVMTGLEKSSDGGGFWYPVSFPSESYLRDIEMNPSIAGDVYMLTYDTLFRSTDFAQSWTVIDDSVGYPYAVGGLIRISKNPPTTIYCLGSCGNIRKSTNYGSSWITHQYSPSYSSTSHLALEIDPSNSNVVYVGRADSVYKTTNGGATWSRTTVGGEELRSIAVDKSNSSVVYVAHENGISKTTNAGTTWFSVFNNESLEDITSMVCLSNGYLLKATSKHGVHVSTDGGVSFRSVGVEQVRPCGMKFQNSDSTLIAWNSGGVYVSTDSGSSWRLSLAKGSSSRSGLSINPTNPSMWLVAAGGYSQNTIYSSNNSGQTWSELGYAAATSAQEVYHSAANSDLVYLRSFYSVSRSTDSGASWTLLEEPIPGENIELLTPSPANQNLLLASANTCLAVVRSDNGGDSWYPYQIGIAHDIWGTYVADLAFDPQDPDVVYASTGSLYKLVFPSSSWSMIYHPSDPSPYSVGKILIDPTNSCRMYSLYSICTLVGSSNGGATWADATGSLPNDYKTASAAFIGTTGKVYLATGAGIIWGSPVVSSVDGPGAVGSFHGRSILGQNFPNPANPSTSIPFGIGSDGRVTLKLFDLLGRMVQILLDENKSAGEYTIDVNTSGLASGIYFYRLQCGPFVDTKKLLLLK